MIKILKNLSSTLPTSFILEEKTKRTLECLEYESSMLYVVTCDTYDDVIHDNVLMLCNVALISF